MLSRIIRKLKNIYESKWWVYIIYYKQKIKKNYIFFESYSASVFQGNVYYVFKTVFNNDKFKKFKFIIASTNPDKLIDFLNEKELYDSRVEVVDYCSNKYIKFLNVSKYLLNNVSFPEYFIKKDSQVYINTWHGTPLKCLGKSIMGDPFVIFNVIRDFLISDYLILPNKITAEILVNDYMIKNITNAKVVETGYPRNEVFFNLEDRATIREKENICNKKVIMYMPTWRGTANGRKREIDYIALMNDLHSKLGDEYIIYLKLHPLDTINAHLDNKLREIPKNYEIYEFLNACDILITDYSSVFFDFANTKRKIYLFQFDQEEYYKERGVYSNIISKIDLPISRNISELSSQILNDYDKKTNISKSFIINFCQNYKSQPTSKIIDYINTEKTIIHQETLLIVISEKVEDDDLKRIYSKYSKKGIVFLFIPKKSNCFYNNITCWKNINYLIGSKSEKYFIYEKILFFINNFIHIKCLKNKVKLIKKREEIRRLGNLNIKKVYFLKNIKDIPFYLTNYKLEKLDID
ncbi:CDP-glycerol glycerophosphotransferase family protein [Thomasclavelia cocleata]|uniref:CDP-glycerol glycerophosphotransferase family protein n=6 Tax=Thomasclavelia cocleata TaxID=69824 RepID=UPI00241C7BBF|nr:CDP-glycerol glycerophosphotransferase family protein [Thomasclavelia cocleata]